MCRGSLGSGNMLCVSWPSERRVSGLIVVTGEGGEEQLDGRLWGEPKVYLTRQWSWCIADTA